MTPEDFTPQMHAYITGMAQLAKSLELNGLQAARLNGLVSGMLTVRYAHHTGDSTEAGAAKIREAFENGLQDGLSMAADINAALAPHH